MKKVYKYGTGHEIPEGAIYLSTIVGTTEEISENTPPSGSKSWKRKTATLIWHYFLVEVKEK